MAIRSSRSPPLYTIMASQESEDDDNGAVISVTVQTHEAKKTVEIAARASVREFKAKIAAAFSVTTTEQT